MVRPARCYQPVRFSRGSNWFKVAGFGHQTDLTAVGCPYHPGAENHSGVTKMHRCDRNGVDSNRDGNSFRSLVYLK